MWNINSLWFEITIVNTVLLIGHIYMGHFEERSPKWRKVAKWLATVIIVVTLSILFGRTVALTVFGLFFIPVVYVHGVLLPRKGINGWTGEPKSKYYEFRGWSKNIFDDKPTKQDS